jgi:hypothetical protein
MWLFPLCPSTRQQQQQQRTNTWVVPAVITRKHLALGIHPSQQGSILQQAAAAHYQPLLVPHTVSWWSAVSNQALG